MGEVLKPFKEEWDSFKNRYKYLSKRKLALAASMIGAGAYIEALGGEESSVYMKIGGAALIVAGAYITEYGSNKEDGL